VVLLGAVGGWGGHAATLTDSVGAQQVDNASPLTLSSISILVLSCRSYQIDSLLSSSSLSTDLNGDLADRECREPGHPQTNAP